ncbi:MAG: penicillin acylase family protein, partial [bacterium]
MKTKIYWAIGLIFFLLLISCMAVITISPKKQNLTQRLHSFPIADLPLEKSATIYWDSHLVPFIEAKTDQDCAFLIGIVQAHLRLAQMTIFRRVVEARLAESVGPIATSIDHALRILNLSAVSDSIEKILPPETKNWIQNYVNGINFYQERLVEKPLEFKLLAIKPEPWEVKDILTIGRLASADVNWFNWFQWLKLRDKPYWQELWNRFLELGFQSTPSFNTSANFISSGIKSGSNAVVIAASRSKDSHAILANDPHLGLQLPNTWMIAGYKCPSFHVVGLMFPGVPMVLAGRNPSIAWGGTNMRSASSDLYELKANQNNNIAVRKEKIKVRWWKDKSVDIRTSEIGPIISDVSFFKVKEGQILAMKWVGHQPTDEHTSFYKINKAANWEEVRQALESYGVSGLNFLYADTNGHIGMVPAVKIPNRSQNRPPDFILDADNPQHQWQGLINPPDLPYVFNPEQGFIVTANNRPFVYNPPLGFFFSANDRADRLKQLLQQNNQVDLNFIKQMQRDVFAPSAFQLRDLMIDKIDALNLVNPENEKQVQLLEVLRQWDGRYHVESKGAVAFQVVLFHLIKNYYSQRYDQDMVELFLSSEHVNTFLQQDLITENPQVLKNILQQALKQATKNYKKFNNWGDLHRLKLSHPLERIPLIGRKFRYGDYPAEGAYNTVMKTAHQISNKRHDTFYGANSRIIIMLRDPDENYFVLLGGQDGWLGSEHFVDQVPLWLKGEYIQIPLRIESVRESFPHQMQLQP